MNPFAMRCLKSALLVGLSCAALSGVASSTGCKQGEGDVCQINDDCEDDLECNAGTRRCQRPGTAGPTDASVPDASGPDAAQ